MLGVGFRQNDLPLYIISASKKLCELWILQVMLHFISLFLKWNTRLGYEGYGVRSVIDRSLQPFTMKTEMKSQLTSMCLVFPNNKHSILSRCYEIKILYCKSMHVYSCTRLIFIYLLKYTMYTPIGWKLAKLLNKFVSSYLDTLRLTHSLPQKYFYLKNFTCYKNWTPGQSVKIMYTHV